jgi:hypothetical protein
MRPALQRKKFSFRTHPMKLLLKRVKQVGASNSRGALFIILATLFVIGAALPPARSKSAPQTLNISSAKSRPSLNIADPSPDYVVTTFTGASIVPGNTDIGNHCDDCTTGITLPFPVILYDQFFTTAEVSSNGNLQFISNNAAYANGCMPGDSGYAFSYTIFPFWDDLYTGDAGSG